MKARPLKKRKGIGLSPCNVEEATHIALNLPGPAGLVFLPLKRDVNRDSGLPQWEWNDDIDSPTIKPSLKTTGGDFLCHCWVTAGEVKFLADSSHYLKGRTVPLLSVDILS